MAATASDAKRFDKPEVDLTAEGLLVITGAKKIILGDKVQMLNIHTIGEGAVLTIIGKAHVNIEYVGRGAMVHAKDCKAVVKIAAQGCVLKFESQPTVFKDLRFTPTFGSAGFSLLSGCNIGGNVSIEGGISYTGVSVVYNSAIATGPKSFATVVNNEPGQAESTSRPVSASADRASKASSAYDSDEFPALSGSESELASSESEKEQKVSAVSPEDELNVNADESNKPYKNRFK